MSEPTATLVRRSGNVTVELALEGVEPRPLPYSRAGGHYAPQRLTLSYRQSDGMPWQYGSPKLSGPKLKKDGTPGLARAEESLWSQVPEWVLFLAEANMPGGAS